MYMVAYALFGMPLAGQSGLPQNLPAGLPEDLLLNPFAADFMWVEQWGTNGVWANAGLWRTGAQVEEELGGDYSQLMRLDNRGVFRDDLQSIFPIPAGSPPNAAGLRVWIGTADLREEESGNDNIDVVQDYTVGELTVQNASPNVGRSFRDGGTIIMDSGTADKPARIIHLGGEDSDGEDFNIRGGTNLRLDSPTEMYLLNTGSRFRVRGNSRILGNGDLILNPGNAFAYTGEATGQEDGIRRELRIEDTGRIATNGLLSINAARVRIVDQGDIINVARIDIFPEGQLQLERSGQVTYNLGNGPIRIGSMGHLMDSGSNGAIRQEANLPADIAEVTNTIEVMGNAGLHARGESTLILSGPVTGGGTAPMPMVRQSIRKSGSGTLRLTGEQSHGGSWNGGWNITNGTVELAGASRLNGLPVTFTSPENERSLRLTGAHSVSLLDGDAQDPEEAESVNTLWLYLQTADTVLTVNQNVLLADGEEQSTRFQGDITGLGGLVKSGDGILRLTRWGKTFSGSTRIEQGVLAVSESAALANTESITVLSGGQLRLTTTGTGVTYEFGGPLSLAGDGRSGAVSDGEGQGVLGALRMDPGGDASESTLRSPVVLEDDAAIHINGVDKTLVLAGAVSGSGDLKRTGGGTLVLRGASSLSGATILNNGTLRVEPTSALGNAAILFDGDLNAATLELLNSQQAAALAGGSSDSRLMIFPGAALMLTEGNAHAPFRGTISGGGSLTKQGPGLLHLQGSISGLQQLSISQGSLRLDNGAAQVGTLQIGSNASADIRGTLSGTPLRVEGELSITEPLNITGANATVNGTLRWLTAPQANTALLALSGDLQFGSTAIIDIRSIGTIATGTTLPLAEVNGAISGIADVTLLSNISGASLQHSGNTLNLVIPAVADEKLDALQAALGEVTAYSDGTYLSAWLGDFSAPAFNATQRWIHIAEQTWWWVYPGANDHATWFLDIDLGPVFTNPDLYPFLFSHDDDSWLYFGGKEDNLRWFFNFSAAQWQQI